MPDPGGGVGCTQTIVLRLPLAGSMCTTAPCGGCVHIMEMDVLASIGSATAVFEWHMGTGIVVLAPMCSAKSLFEWHMGTTIVALALRRSATSVFE